MVAASTSTRTWPGPGAAASNSTNCRTSAGSPIAVIWSLRMVFRPDMLGLILFDDMQCAQGAAELHQPPALTQATHQHRGEPKRLAKCGKLGVDRVVVAGEEQHLAPIVVPGVGHDVLGVHRVECLDDRGAR